MGQEFQNYFNWERAPRRKIYYISSFNNWFLFIKRQNSAKEMCYEDKKLVIAGWIIMCHNETFILLIYIVIVYVLLLCSLLNFGVVSSYLTFYCAHKQIWECLWIILLLRRKHTQSMMTTKENWKHCARMMGLFTFVIVSWSPAKLERLLWVSYSKITLLLSFHEYMFCIYVDKLKFSTLLCIFG